MAPRRKHNKSMTFLTDPSSPFLTCKRAPSDDVGSDNFNPVCCFLEHSKLAVFQRMRKFCSGFGKDSILEGLFFARLHTETLFVCACNFDGSCISHHPFAFWPRCLVHAHSSSEPLRMRNIVFIS